MNTPSTSLAVHQKIGRGSWGLEDPPPIPQHFPLPCSFRGTSDDRVRSGRSSAAPCCSLRRRLQVGDKWAQKTVPALAQLSVSPVITGSPLGRCLRGWGEVQEVRPVPPPSSSDGGGTGRSSSGRRRLGGGSTAGGVSALQTVRHDHLEPQTRVPIPLSLHILTCVSHHSHSRRSLDIRRRLRLYGARLQDR